MVGSAITLSYPKFVQHIVDIIAIGGGRETVDQAALWLVVFLFLGAISSAIRAYLFTVAGEHVVAQLREQLYQAVLLRPIAFFDERRTGELMSRLSSDTTVLQNTVTVNLSMLLRFLVMGLGAVGMLFATSVLLTIITLSVVPIVAVGGGLLGRRIRHISRRVQDGIAEASEVAEETLSGVRTVRAFGMEKQEITRYNTAIDKAFALATQRARAIALFRGLVGFAGYAAVALVFWRGGILLLEGLMSMGELTAFLLYTTMVAVSFGGLAGLWEDFAKAIGASERVFDLLDGTQQAAMSSGELQLSEPSGSIDFQSVSFCYPSRPDSVVLDRFDLQLKFGRVVALVGPSGAGKSTVAALMSRFYDPNEGTLLFDGHDYSELDVDWLRHQIGVVSQEPILFATSIEENIRYGRVDASQDDLIAAAKAANAHEFITALSEGYQTKVGERGVRLSGGQKQRVAIARALLRDPRVLILDEATSALDAESEHLVQEALERLMKGRTTLVIAHRLSTVMGADRVVVMEEGHVVQRGTHQQLVSQSGLYRRLVERQFVA